MPNPDSSFAMNRGRLLAALEQPGSGELLASADYRDPQSGTTFTVHPRQGGGIEMLFGPKYYAFDTHGNYQDKHPEADVATARIIAAALVPEYFVTGKKMKFGAAE